jgi:SpoVK/Ycf46/Vps4 family AAA+-type ATPase
VLATFLTWMQEKKTPVFVFATANDVERLPMEFLRKGRFDEVFFLDLPTAVEREQILEVHLNRRGLSMVRRQFDLPRVVQATEGFVGAELEAVVKDAFFPAFMDGRRRIETDDLVRAAGAMVPLAKSHPDRIARLRALVQNGQARNASMRTGADEVQVERVRGERLLDV